MKTGLIVTGAFGHRSSRELLFGFVSRKVTNRSEVPVFLSH